MSSARVVNLVTAALTVVALLVAAIIVVAILQRQRGSVPEPLPTVALLPTSTPTNTPRPTIPPTFTDTPTISPTPTFTITPSLTASVTPTITDTPTATPTPAQSATPIPTVTFTPSATSDATRTPTRSPFPFRLRGGEAILTENTYNTAGCSYQAVAGQVFGLQGEGLSGIEVYAVTDGGLEFGDTSGDSTAFGEGGYEVVLGSEVNGRIYSVELRSPGGTVLSERVLVKFPASCDQNVALIYWVQTRPF